MNGEDEDDGDGEGWDDDGEGWDDEEEDELDPVVAEALANAKRKRELEEKISEVTITFRPQGYRQGMIARIVGDFTDWVPFTMSMHPMSEILKDDTKHNEFFVVIKLAKGFRYRYVFEVDGREEIDMDDPNRGPNHEGRVTNYVEVAGNDESLTVGDFMK